MLNGRFPGNSGTFAFSGGFLELIDSG